eukprot:5507844-Pyramimonas_sp.AAC.1
MATPPLEPWVELLLGRDSCEGVWRTWRGDAVGTLPRGAYVELPIGYDSCVWGRFELQRCGHGGCRWNSPVGHN